MRPIQQFHRVDDGNIRAEANLRHAAEIAGRDHIRAYGLDVLDFPRAQLRRQFGLQDVVSSGGTAAQMAFRNVDDREAGPLQQRLWFLSDLLAMLHRACRVVGNADGAPTFRRAKIGGRDKLGDIAREISNLCGAFRIVATRVLQ